MFLNALQTRLLFRKSPYRGRGGGVSPLPHPPPARSLRSLAEDLRQMCLLRGFAPPKLSVPARLPGANIKLCSNVSFFTFYLLQPNQTYAPSWVSPVMLMWSSTRTRVPLRTSKARSMRWVRSIVPSIATLLSTSPKSSMNRRRKAASYT